MTTHEIVTRAEAKARGLTHYFTGKQCRRGHVDRRRTQDGRCLQCGNENSSRWAMENPEKRAAYVSGYVAANMGRIRQYQNEYRRRNPDAARRWANEGYARDIEHSRAMKRKAYQNNKETFLALSVKRRARKLLATPSWDAELTSLVEVEAFNLAARRERATGLPWHVDHMVPLQARNACGLHVWNNLQVIPARLNASKSNHMQFTQPGEWIAHV